MKRLFKLFIFGLLLLSTATTASAYDFKVDGLCYYKNSNGTSVTLTYETSTTPRYSSLNGPVVIPNEVTYNGTAYSVTAIGNNAFTGCTGITSVVIPTSITSIGSNCFKNCTGLTSVNWNAKSCNDFTSTTSTQPFYGLTSISSITFGNEVEKIPAYLCYQLSGLTGELVIPNSVTTIGGTAFYHCSGLTSITVGESVTAISGSVFTGCSGFTSINWNCKSCNDFSSSPFSSSSPSSISFGNEVEKIPAYLFSGFTSITGDLVIPNSVTSIGNYAFNNCSGISSISIGESVITIGKSAFSGCTTEDLVIPSSVTTIDRGAFLNCNIERVILEDGDTELDNEYASYSSGSGSGATYRNTFETSNAKYLYIGRKTKEALIGGSTATVSGGNNSTVTEIVISCNQKAMETLCKNLETLTFYNTITALPTKGFNSKVIRNVYAYWADPPTIQESFFTTEAYSNGILHVPHGTLSAYKSRTGWKNFTIVDDLSSNPGTNNLVTEVSLTPSNLDMVVGEIRRISANVEPEEATNIVLEWSSSDEEVVIVDSNGLVEALAEGTAVVTATTTDGSNLSAQCEIVVRQPQDYSRNELCLSSGNCVIGTVNTDVFVPVLLSNSGAITSLSLSIMLPERINLVDGLDSFVELTERSEGLAITSEQNSDGTVTITGTADEPIEAGSGPLLNLKVRTQWQNTYEIPVTGVAVTTADGTVHELPDSVTRLVMQGVRGDMNGDNRVDLSDALYIINMSTGQAE